MTTPLVQRLSGAVASLLALLSLSATAAQPDGPASEPPLVAGPFTLQTLQQRSGLDFNANYGFVRHTYYERRVLYRGQPLALADAKGRKSTAFRDAWVLPDAVRPALLVGDAGWWLVTERDGQPQVQTLVPGDELSAGAGGQLQWIDQPERRDWGDVRRTRATDGEPMALPGGRQLLLEGRVLLDAQTLRWRALDAQAVPEGYQPAERSLLGASPDGRAFARLYVGPSRSERDALIVVYGTERAEHQRLALDLVALAGPNRAFLVDDLLKRHFDWRLQDGALPRLQPRPAANPNPWQSSFQFGLAAPRSAAGRPLPRYTLSPVRPTMLAAVGAELSRAMGYPLQPPEPGDPDAAGFLRLKASPPVVLRLDAARHALVVESEAAAPALAAQSAVKSIGEHLDRQLAGGAWREHLAPR